MGSTIRELAKRQLIPGVPSFLPDNTHYEVITGSVAYGVSSDTSDMDVVGWCIPNKETVFPHLRGEIIGFDDPEPDARFKVWQKHHIQDKDAMGGAGREWDLNVYNITHYFRLCLNNNPNMIDTLFVPERCILFQTPIGQIVRENRKMFLHRKCWHTFKGYAYSQLHKLNIKNPTEGKRKDLVDKYGYDTKFAYHVPRLLNEVEQILSEGDLDLERSREQLKAIRRGEWTKDELMEYAQTKEKQLEKVYNESCLPYGPRTDEIKDLLMRCLTMHFGNLDRVIFRADPVTKALQQIEDICAKLHLEGHIS